MHYKLRNLPTAGTRTIHQLNVLEWKGRAHCQGVLISRSFLVAETIRLAAQDLVAHPLANHARHVRRMTPGGQKVLLPAFFQKKRMYSCHWASTRTHQVERHLATPLGGAATAQDWRISTHATQHPSPPFVPPWPAPHGLFRPSRCTFHPAQG